MLEEGSVPKRTWPTERRELDEEIRSLSEVGSGDNGKEVTPVPMPNTAVKLFCADGSWRLPPARVGRCRATAKTPE